MTIKDKIAFWYSLGLWTDEMVRQAAEKGVLTAEDAAEILGEGAKR